MLNRLYKGSIVAFICFWIFYIFLDYWHKHPVYATNISNFEYYNLLTIWAVIGATVTWGVLQLKKNKNLKKYITGLSIFGLALLLMLINTQVVLSKLNMPMLGGVSFGVFMGGMLYASISTYLSVAVSYVLGSMITRPFGLSLTKLGTTILNIAFGIVGIVGILFVLGIFSLLKWFIIAPIFLLIIGLGWASSVAFFKSSLISPIRLPKSLNALGIVSFYIVLVFFSINFVQVNMPFPRGWDAMSLYINLPSLINDYDALVKGFQPYNWSLFMSLGYVLFGTTEVTLCLSALGGILTLLPIYYLGRNWLKMDVNYSLLSVAIFYAIPAVGFQAFSDQKVDLGLLFILMVIVMLLHDWIKMYLDKQAEAVAENKYFILAQPHFILMGLLTGFAMGIKLTTIFTVLAVLAAIWYVLKGVMGFFTIFAFSIFGILLLRMDEMSGLRAYHLGVDIIQWIMLIIGIIMLVYLFLKDKVNVLKGVRWSVIYGVFLILPFLPWLTKNYIESGGKASVNTLLNGSSEAPVINLNEVINNYNNYKQKR